MNKKNLILTAIFTLAVTANAQADWGDRKNQQLDRRGDRIENRLDRKGDIIDRRLDR